MLTYHIGPKIENSTLGRVSFFLFQLFGTLQKQTTLDATRFSWLQFRLQARVEQMGVVFKITRGCRGKQS